MRVTILTDTYPPDVNGVANTLRRLAEGLRRMGHQVEVVKPSGVEEEAGEPERGFKVDVMTVPVPNYGGVKVGFPGYGVLWRQWRGNPPDVVYVATESPFGYSGVKAASDLGIAVATGYHTQFERYARDYRLGGLESVASAYLKAVHNRSDCTFVPAEDIGADLVAAGYENVRLLGRGVDADLFRPERRDAALRREWGVEGDDGLVVLAVGRVAAEKNLPLAFRAFESIRERVPGAVMVVVGDGPKRAGYEADYPGVKFVGTKCGEELAACYASADLFLFPSLTETFGNVLLEALASGLVTVSFRYAASAEHVLDGVSGLQAKFEDEEGFVGCAIEAVDACVPGGEMRREARKVALGVSWEMVVNRFEMDLFEMTAVAATRHIKQASLRPESDPMNEKQLRYRTIFLSDVHLGTPDCKIAEVNDFLRRTRCEKLVLNGDIIDGWHLKRKLGNWSNSHTHFVRIVLAKIEKEGTEVVYLRGNHDDILERFLPLNIGNFQVANDHLHETPYGNYLVLHGDGFDRVTTDYRWVALAGAVGYEMLLKVNRGYNRVRRWMGKPEFSLSKAVKARVKTAVSFVGRYEEQLKALAERRGCRGIICGHIHTPADKKIGNVHYLNSGDWVESLTAVVETLDRRFQVLSYEEFLEEARGTEAIEVEEKPALEAAILAGLR